MKTLNLNELDTSECAVDKGGVLYPVRAITARVANMIKAADTETDGTRRMELYYDAAALLLPTMPRTEVDDLTAKQIGGLLALATTQVTAVEEAAADPNAESPATATTSGLSPVTT